MPEINPPDNLPTEPEPASTPAANPTAPEEAPVQEFFKREEIKTMGRDVAALREAEAKEEKGRIASLRSEIKIQQPSPLESDKVKNETMFHRPPAPPISPILKPEGSILPTPIIPPVPPLPRQSPAPQDEGGPTPPNLLKKIVIRGLIIFLGLSVFGFGFWLWQGKESTAKKQPAETETSTSTQEIIPSEETIQMPTIQERLVTWGFLNIMATRTIDTVIVHSNYNALGGDPYDVEKVRNIEGLVAHSTFVSRRH